MRILYRLGNAYASLVWRKTHPLLGHFKPLRSFSIVTSFIERRRIKNPSLLNRLTYSAVATTFLVRYLLKCSLLH
jgi:hypothetical protein